jgi:hypothetical protein
MKLFATLCALVAADGTGTPDWPGQDINAGETCGSSGSVEANAVNATCTISFGGFNPVFVSVAGAFKTGDNQYTGFDGISDSEKQNFLVFWEQSFDANSVLDNSTCGTAADVSITCVDNGAADATANLVGNFIMDPRQTSFQVPVANHEGNGPFAYNAEDFEPITNATCEESGSSLACDFGGENGDLAYFGFNGAAGNSNF